MLEEKFSSVVQPALSMLIQGTFAMLMKLDRADGDDTRDNDSGEDGDLEEDSRGGRFADFHLFGFGSISRVCLKQLLLSDVGSRGACRGLEERFEE